MRCLCLWNGTRDEGSIGHFQWARVLTAKDMPNLNYVENVGRMMMLYLIIFNSWLEVHIVGEVQTRELLTWNFSGTKCKKMKKKKKSMK